MSAPGGSCRRCPRRWRRPSTRPPATTSPRRRDANQDEPEPMEPTLRGPHRKQCPDALACVAVVAVLLDLRDLSDNVRRHGLRQRVVAVLQATQRRVLECLKRGTYTTPPPCPSACQSATRMHAIVVPHVRRPPGRRRAGRGRGRRERARWGYGEAEGPPSSLRRRRLGTIRCRRGKARETFFICSWRSWRREVDPAGPRSAYSSSKTVRWPSKCMAEDLDFSVRRASQEGCRLADDRSSRERSLRAVSPWPAPPNRIPREPDDGPAAVAVMLWPRSWAPTRRKRAQRTDNVRSSGALAGAVSFLREQVLVLLVAGRRAARLRRHPLRSAALEAAQQRLRVAKRVQEERPAVDDVGASSSTPRPRPRGVLHRRRSLGGPVRRPLLRVARRLRLAGLEARRESGPAFAPLAHLLAHQLSLAQLLAVGRHVGRLHPAGEQPASARVAGHR